MPQLWRVKQGAQWRGVGTVGTVLPVFPGSSSWCGRWAFSSWLRACAAGVRTLSRVGAAPLRP